MSNYNNKPVVSSLTRFSAAPMSDLEFSRMHSDPVHLTTFNAGEIVPIYYAEVLPHDTFSIDLDFVIRQNTLLSPTMGNMDVDYYAFFVPNRIINHSWKAVQGENLSGKWTSPEVQLAPLVGSSASASYNIPVGSVADYYGFPTQAAIPNTILQQCNDLKFRGYLECYNQYFRDQNYQPPLPYSKLNVYEGFMEPVGTAVALSPTGAGPIVLQKDDAPSFSSGSVGPASVKNAVYGDGPVTISSSGATLGARLTSWSALSAPLKANKHHDYFTSVLPSPQKGLEVTFSFSEDVLPVDIETTDNISSYWSNPLRFSKSGSNSPAGDYVLGLNHQSAGPFEARVYSGTASGTSLGTIDGWNIESTVDLSAATGINLNEIRTGAAVQQVYEVLARGGSRYREFIDSFFGLNVDDPFGDIPKYLGHFRRSLDLYQTAQTSASSEGSTPQGNLAAFGYTANSGNLVNGFTAVEHGYIHIFAVVRHRNIYSSYFAKDNFRLGQLDFYLPQLANLSEQPVYTREINPFSDASDAVFGYNEAWSEYRFEPDRVSGLMRPGVDGSLSVWNYADDFNSALTVATGDFMKSNSKEVLDRTLAVTSAVAPQLKACFCFHVTKQRPMPTYSVPGLDII